MQRRLQKELKKIREEKLYTVEVKEKNGAYDFSLTIPLAKNSMIAEVENIDLPSDYPFGAPDLHGMGIRLYKTRPSEQKKTLIENSIIVGKPAISTRLMRNGIIDRDNVDSVIEFHNLFSMDNWGPTLGLIDLVEGQITKILEKYVLLFSKKRSRDEDDLAAAIELSKGPFFQKIKL